MFDAEEKIVLFNQRYADMMNLPVSDLVGLSLLELLRRRKASGVFTGDPERLNDEVLGRMRAGRTDHQDPGIRRWPRAALRQSADAAGGWVATFEDITEQRTFEQERERHARVSEPDPRQRAGDDRGEGRGRAEVRSRQPRGGGVLGLFPQGGHRQDAARAFPARQSRCDRQRRHRGAEVRSRGRAGGASKPWCFRTTAPGDVEASHHSRRRRQAAIAGQRRRGRDRAKASGARARPRPGVPEPDHRKRADHDRREGCATPGDMS